MPKNLKISLASEPQLKKDSETKIYNINSGAYTLKQKITTAEFGRLFDVLPQVSTPEELTVQKMLKIDLVEVAKIIFAEPFESTEMYIEDFEIMVEAISDFFERKKKVLAFFGKR